MNCEPFREHISAWLDGELPDDAATAMEQHLLACPDCGTYADDLREQQSLLGDLATADESRAAKLAASVIDRLTAVQPTGPEWRPAKLRRALDWLMGLLVGAAASWLAAWWVWNPAESPVPDESRDVGAIDGSEVEKVEEDIAPIVARLVNVIGDVRVTIRQNESIAFPADLATFLCPSDSTIETGADSRCELVTSSGCVVRLNDATRLVVRSPSEVEIHEGQLYCTAPEGAELRVLAAGESIPSSVVSPGFDATQFQCKSNTSLWTSKSSSGVRVVSASGEIELQFGAQTATLQTGESAEIVDGTLLPVGRAEDPLFSTRWIHPLLIQNGPADGELKQRVDDMLAKIGLSKVSNLYEAELRSLGEYSVLPLIRYLESPLSDQDVHRRRVAARIVSDLAVTWTISDLIQLLGHADGEVRARAAEALARLTGETHERAPDQWREESPDNDAARELWVGWWQRNRGFYPSLEDAGKSSPRSKEF